MVGALGYILHAQTPPPDWTPRTSPQPTCDVNTQPSRSTLSDRKHNGHGTGTEGPCPKPSHSLPQPTTGRMSDVPYIDPGSTTPMSVEGFTLKGIQYIYIYAVCGIWQMYLLRWVTIYMKHMASSTTTLTMPLLLFQCTGRHLSHLTLT